MCGSSNNVGRASNASIVVNLPDEKEPRLNYPFDPINISYVFLD
jgi:hypothetical protein